MWLLLCPGTYQSTQRLKRAIATFDDRPYPFPTVRTKPAPPPLSYNSILVPPHGRSAALQSFSYRQNLLCPTLHPANSSRSMILEYSNFFIYTGLCRIALNPSLPLPFDSLPFPSVASAPFLPFPPLSLPLYCLSLPHGRSNLPRIPAHRLNTRSSPLRPFVAIPAGDRLHPQ